MNAENANRDVAKIAALLSDAGYGPAESWDAAPVAGAGSSRRYYRLTERDSGRTLIGTAGDSPEENEAFVDLAAALSAAGVPTPRVVAVSADSLVYLQTDAGRRSLYDLIAADRREAGTLSDAVRQTCRRVASELPRWQFAAAAAVDWSQCRPVAEASRQVSSWDLNYFKYEFLMVSGAVFDQTRLDADFARLLDELDAPDIPVAFQFRDFQSRNLMAADDGTLTVIDFQAGRRGNAVYDLVSFAGQTRAGFSDEMQRELADAYFESLQSFCPLTRERFDEIVRTTWIFRRLQTLGAYGFRGLVEGKPAFVTPITDTLDALRADSTLRELCPEIAAALDSAARSPRIASLRKKSVAAGKPGRLTIGVTSFSYKKGYPDDPSGNGGGFVFDCRGMENPGRYERYRLLTGRDDAVISFLDSCGEIGPFVLSAQAVVKPTVENYIKRGFSHLEIAFGCTGGQHRSLRSADLMARWLVETYDVDVVLRHREQGIEERLTPAARPRPLKAMVFAAGIGSRLRPLTDRCPKALIDVGGQPMLGRVLAKLRDAGVRTAVVNIHHHAAMVADWLASHDFSPMKVVVSDESDLLLDTGGGLLRALDLMGCDSDVVVHNADILTDFPLAEMIEAHRASGADATLLVDPERESSRRLLFDPATLRMRGWTNTATGAVRPAGLDAADCSRMAFGGVHVLAPSMLRRLKGYRQPTDVFSIMDFYIDSCAAADIRGHIPSAPYAWFDIGRPATLEAARLFAGDGTPTAGV